MVVRILLRIIYPGKFNNPPAHHPTTPHDKHTHIQTRTCTHALITFLPLYRLRLVEWFPQVSSCSFCEKTRVPSVLSGISCTPETLDKWFADYSEFVHQHGLQDKPQRIWNADESGFPLCPKTSRVLCRRNKKHIYSVHSDSKSQITTLVAASAAGSVIPPMHIFPGKHFGYNPLDGAVAGAYMGRNDNGWMVTQLFYGWLANHFVSYIPPECPDCRWPYNTH